MPDIVDDKSSICIRFILNRIAAHQRDHDTPFFLGLNGIQGAGKTTLVRSPSSSRLSAYETSSFPALVPTHIFSHLTLLRNLILLLT